MSLILPVALTVRGQGQGLATVHIGGAILKKKSGDLNMTVV
jgi:hypothetical protein